MEKVFGMIDLYGSLETFFLLVLCGICSLSIFVSGIALKQKRIELDKREKELDKLESWLDRRYASLEDMRIRMEEKERQIHFLSK